MVHFGEGIGEWLCWPDLLSLMCWGLSRHIARLSRFSNEMLFYVASACLRLGLSHRVACCDPTGNSALSSLNARQTGGTRCNVMKRRVTACNGMNRMQRAQVVPVRRWVPDSVSWARLEDAGQMPLSQLLGPPSPPPLQPPPAPSTAATAIANGNGNGNGSRGAAGKNTGSADRGGPGEGEGGGSGQSDGVVAAEESTAGKVSGDGHPDAAGQQREPLYLHDWSLPQNLGPDSSLLRDRFQVGAFSAKVLRVIMLSFADKARPVVYSPTCSSSGPCHISSRFISWDTTSSLVSYGIPRPYHISSRFISWDTTYSLVVLPRLASSRLVPSHLSPTLHRCPGSSPGTCCRGWLGKGYPTPTGTRLLALGWRCTAVEQGRQQRRCFLSLRWPGQPRTKLWLSCCCIDPWKCCTHARLS